MVDLPRLIGVLVPLSIAVFYYLKIKGSRLSIAVILFILIHIILVSIYAVYLSMYDLKVIETLHILYGIK